MEERIILAEALWRTTKQENRDLIQEYNDELNKALENVDERNASLVVSIMERVESKYREKAVLTNKMTISLFEALDLAYTIVNE